MRLSSEPKDFKHKNIEIEQNQILIFLQNFWKFSKFYGEYLASLHSKNKSNFSSKAAKKRREN